VRRKLEAWIARAKAAGVDANGGIAVDIPARAIERTARKVAADLIVMGTRDLAGLQRVFLGSVAERTVRTAPGPVLTVNASSSADAEN